MKILFTYIRSLWVILLLSTLLPYKLAYAGLDVTSFVSASCVNYKVVGSCRLGTAVVVNHYIPVAFIEVVRGPGDSVFSPNVLSTLSFATRLTGDYTGFDVRVWEITDLMRNAAFNIGACAFCNYRQYKIRANFEKATSNSNAQPSDICGDTVVGAAIKQTKILTSLMLAPLAYTTEMDPLSWRTGCRDKIVAYTSAASCSVLAGSPNSTNLPGPESCLGSWGPLFPRQYRSTNADITGAAHAAYRAVHIASRTFKTANFPMKGAKMQLAYPNKSPCFDLGENALELEQKIRASQNGVYGFVWWVKLVCCKGFEEFATCSTVADGVAEPISSPIEGGVGQIPGLDQVPVTSLGP